MSVGKSPDRFLPSLLDRLIDHEPDVSTEPAWRQAQSVQDLEKSVLRDLEALLNTRCTTPVVPAGCEELRRSSVTFGLPDFTAAGIANREERDRIRRAVQQAIEAFEPRLSRVRVAVGQEDAGIGRSMRLTIEAILNAYPDPVLVTFDTVLEPTSGACKIEAK
jgi:type VI secretion system protein ImpF